MVNKKLSRKKVKKVSVRVKNKSGSPSVSKKDFEAFKFGVQRLKELEKELNSLDTRGFSGEVQKIKQKIKNVSEIPNIERLMKNLKLKIHNKYKPKKRRHTPAKEIKEGLEDVQEEITKLRRSKRDESDELKKQIENLKRSKSLALGDIKEEIRKLRKSSSKKVSVDSGVDVLVDANFNQFLNETKQALSQRIIKREEDIDEVLKSDLGKRDAKYRQKNDALIKDFEKKKKKLEDEYERKYKRKVESELHREISSKFNSMLKEKLNKEKVELGKEYKNQLKMHSENVLNNKKAELEKDFENKREKFERYEDEEKRKMGEKILNETHRKVEAELKKKEISLRKQLRNEYDLRLKKQIENHEAELKKTKLDLEMEMQRKIKQLLS